jgi:RND family efflux transporter MFP subunit
MVLEVLVVAGEPVSASNPIAIIALPSQLELIADVDELDLPNVQPGANVRFRLDAFPATEVEGRVASTSPQAEVRGGATVFAATIAFAPQPALDLRPGMNADVTIITAARENVLLVPDRALRTVGERSFVTVVTDDGEEEREVTLGYRGPGQVEIVAGLAEGERVVLR